MMLRSLAAVTLIGAIAMITACADGSDPHHLPGGPGSDGGSGGGGAGDGAKPGLIIVQTTPGLTGAAAIFSAVPVTGCTTRTIGPCQVRSCPNPGDEPGPRASAGRVTISDGHADLVMDPDAENSYDYAPPDTGGAHFASGATLTASAAGADVPAFHGVTAVLPEPLAPVSADIAIDVTRDLVVGWTGGGPGGKVVFLSETDDPQTIGQLSCAFDPAAHTGTVPAAALQAVPPCGPDAETCVWSLEPTAAVHFVAGDFAIDYWVRGAGAIGEWTR